MRGEREDESADVGGGGAAAGDSRFLTRTPATVGYRRD